MTNPFDDQDASFFVLTNEEDQYCLWPAFAAVPDGWSVTRPAGSRAEALSFVEEAWTDMRPRSVRGAAGVDA